MSKLPILIIAVIIIIVLAALMYQKHFFPSTTPSNALKTKPSTTNSLTSSTTTIISNTIPSSTTTIIPSTSTTTTIPSNTFVFISDVNIEYLYTGPTANISNASCNYFNTTSPYTYDKLFTAGSNFNINLTLTASSSCQLTIRNISSITPGFEISQTNPILPYTLPGHNSQAYIQINITAPLHNFSGPLSLTIHEI